MHGSLFASYDLDQLRADLDRYAFLLDGTNTAAA